MKTIAYLTFLTLALTVNCFGQTVDYLQINPKLDSLDRTKICTDFQSFHCIETCSAKMSSDTLKIRFFKQTASTFDDLTVFIVDNKVVTTFKTVYIVLDRKGKNEWLPIKQSVFLDSTERFKDSEIKGKIDIEFQEIYIEKNGEKHETRTIRFTGQFIAIIT